MESAEGTHASSQRETGFKPAFMPDPRRKRSAFARWLLASIAVLLIACLAGGLFVYLRLQPTRSTPGQTAWCVSTADQPTGNLDLTHLTALSPTNVWTFGTITQGNAGSIQFASLVEHWNGSKWSIVPTADTAPLLHSLQGELDHPMSEAMFLNSMTVVSADNIWAAGAVTVQKGRLSGDEFGHTLIEHWDGHQWQVVASPDGNAQGFNSLSSIVAISANDIWAAGTTGPSTEPSTTPLVEHWDGNNWSVVQLPTSLHGKFLNGISALSANDIWAVGAASTANNSNELPLAVHWDGHSWSTALLAPDLNAGEFSTVKAISANDIWATETLSPQGSPQPVLAHWNGQQWSRVGRINGAPADSHFWGITAGGANNVWIVGDTPGRGQSPYVTQPLVEHWNGQSWNRVALPAPVYGSLSDVAIAGGKVWVVGGSTDSTGQSPRILIATTC